MIKVTNLTKIFNKNKPNEHIALKDISFYINPKELVLLKGESGSGKSTLLSLIAGLLKPTSGDIEIEGEKIAKLPDNFSAIFRLEKIGFIFQKFNLIPTLSVFDNIILPLIPSKLSQKEIENKAKKVMQKFSIEHKKDTLAKQLSGGEQQRVAIARALINNPKIILADEPTANLDKQLSYDFLEFVKELKRDGKTVLIATHDPIFEELNIIDKNITISKGHILS